MTNVMHNATKQTKTNYCTVFDYVQGAAGRDAARALGNCITLCLVITRHQDSDSSEIVVHTQARAKIAPQNLGLV